MTLFSEFFSTQIIGLSQSAIAVVLGLFLLNEWLLKRRRVASFQHFENVMKAYDIPELGMNQFLISTLIVSQFILLALSLYSGAYIYSLVYLTNTAVLSITWMFSLVGFATNRDLSRFSKDQQRILRLESLIPKQEERIVSYQNEYEAFKHKINLRHREFSPYIGNDTFQSSYGKLHEFKHLIDELKSYNLSTQVQRLKEEFEDGLREFITTNRKASLREVDESIPNEAALNDILQGVEKYISDDTKLVSSKMFQDFSKYDEQQIIDIIDIATKYRFSVTSNQIDLILERVKVLPSKSELLNRLYTSNAITAPVIIHYLEQDQDWIITPQMYEILKSGELSNVLSLLVEKNLLQSAKKFLQQLPVLKLQILYRVTGEIKNQTSDLILEFRSFLPLRFLFSDPSTMYFNMYNALLESRSMKPLNSDLPLSEAIISNKQSIVQTYQEQYEALAPLRQQFESVKLNLLSSNLRQSTFIKLETAMELFYQYVVNLRDAEASILFDFLEAVFLLEETDPLKVSEYMTNRGTPVAASVTLEKHRVSGKTKLKQLINKQRSLIKQLMSRMEHKRLSYDRLLEMVK